MTKTCETCLYYWAHPDQGPDWTTAGQCRRLSPVPVGGMHNQVNQNPATMGSTTTWFPTFGWPSTGPDDWCGEGKWKSVDVGEPYPEGWLE